MERYGYLTSSATGIECIHDKLFQDLSECIRHAISHKTDVIYFKVMSTSQVIQEIHADSTDEKYGYIYLHMIPPSNIFSVCKRSSKFFVHLLDCIIEARSCNLDVPDHPSYRYKIAYFKKLPDEKILQELHCV